MLVLYIYTFMGMNSWARVTEESHEHWYPTINDDYTVFVFLVVRSNKTSFAFKKGQYFQKCTIRFLRFLYTAKFYLSDQYLSLFFGNIISQNRNHYQISIIFNDVCVFFQLIVKNCLLPTGYVIA